MDILNQGNMNLYLKYRTSFKKCAIIPPIKISRKNINSRCDHLCSTKLFGSINLSVKQLASEWRAAVSSRKHEDAAWTERKNTP